MPRDTLTREQIVSAAIDLLDAEGLEGLNMRALGQRLGSAATAVYRHVGSKDNLIALAAMATDLYETLIRHPWLAQAFGSQLLYGPGKARQDDHGLAIYEAAGFTGEQADQVAVTVLTFVLGHALGAAAEASLTRKLGQAGGDGAALLRDRMAGAHEIAARFPRLRARLDTAAAGYGASPEDSFEFGLQVILDGLQDRLARRR